jgi:hypothetical protein
VAEYLEEARVRVVMTRQQFIAVMFGLLTGPIHNLAWPKLRA